MVQGKTKDKTNKIRYKPDHYAYKKHKQKLVRKFLSKLAKTLMIKNRTKVQHYLNVIFGNANNDSGLNQKYIKLVILTPTRNTNKTTTPV